MANSTIGYTAPGAPTGLLDSESLTVGANTVERERIQLAGTIAAAIAAVLATAPASGDYGLAVRSGDGHDVTLGALADAVVAAGAAGSVSAKLRRLTTDLDATLAKVEAVRALLAGTLAVSAASLPLPSGAASETTLALLGTEVTAAAILAALAGNLSTVLDSTALDAQGALPTAETYGVSTAGGQGNTFIISAASNNAQFLKATPGQVYSITFNNLSDSKRYLKFYNKASAPNPAADTPLWGLVLGEQSDGHINFPHGLDIFSVGIALAITGGSAAADNTAIGAAEVWADIGWY